MTFWGKFTLLPCPPPNYREFSGQTYKPTIIMEAQMNHLPTREEIQVYKNDFFSGIVMLMKKLFML